MTTPHAADALAPRTEPDAIPDDAGQQGLSSDEAARRLAQRGPNAVVDAASRPVFRALGKLWAPIPWMLEAAAVLELLLGRRAEAAIIAGLLGFNAALAFLQEHRAQGTLDALKSRLALMASVRRDGVWRTVAAAALVDGDVVKLTLGAIVPADVRLLDGDLLVDASMLTGESVPVEIGPGGRTYAGALVRRGEATAAVTATGTRTTFGRTAELVRTAQAPSSEERAIVRVVRNLALTNGVVVVLLVAYARVIALPIAEILPLVLTASLASIPVALPATFTLAGALAARRLARHGVLPTRLSAVHEAAAVDVLCTDKTGTLTQNQLSVAGVRAAPGFTEGNVLALGALASSDSELDVVDAAVRAAAIRERAVSSLTRTSLVPFDPATRVAEAVAADAQGRTIRVVKGAYAAVGPRAPAASMSDEVRDLQTRGYRVLAVASATPEDGWRLVGVIALSDAPRSDSAGLIRELHALGVRTIMVTGDAPETAAAVGRAVGLTGPVCPPGTSLADIDPGQFAIFAGVRPDDKFGLVQTLQRRGHTVGMCGDGANDAPALRQAQMGIAVATATDAAKSAAGLVLTQPGLGGIVVSIREGRATFERILTYALNSILKKIVQVLLLAVGLVLTAHAILTPLQMVIVMVTNDFLTMSLVTERVSPADGPGRWRVRALTIAGIVFGLCDLAFCSLVLAAGELGLQLGPAQLRTVAFVALVTGSQAVLYCVRDRRRRWSRPGAWLVASSCVDLGIVSTLAIRGIAMPPLPGTLVLEIFAAALVFGVVMTLGKRPLFALTGLTPPSTGPSAPGAG
ncbi:MAG TPA: HAD-IC family P-type ATPase [Vicinamibacterales bacterium]|nr:HAD-IC family P-type ATPase [Vicinamibacterales bacterium]